MKKLVLAILALVIFSLAACSTITTPVAITDNPVGPKTGEATAVYLFGYLPTQGDKSLSTAAANGGVTKIATVEQRVQWTPIQTKVTTIVTGN
jgi:hypothetical protein